jgi:hypothetical protein
MIRRDSWSSTSVAPKGGGALAARIVYSNTRARARGAPSGCVCARVPAQEEEGSWGWREGAGDNTRWQARTPSGLRGRERGCCAACEKGKHIHTYIHTYDNPIEWASRATTSPLFCPLRSSRSFSRSSLFSARALSLSLSLSLPAVLGITHWCYNPLVLRRRTCYPVSNTLFFLSGFISLRHPYAHFAAVWSPGDRRAPIVESVMPKQEILRWSSGVDGPSRARLNIVIRFSVENRHRCIYRKYHRDTCCFIVLRQCCLTSILHPLLLARNSRTNCVGDLKFLSCPKNDPNDGNGIFFESQLNCFPRYCLGIISK